MVRYIDFSKSCPLLGVGKDVHFFMMFCKNSGTRHPSEKPGVGGHRILAPRRIQYQRAFRKTGTQWGRGDKLFL